MNGKIERSAKALHNAKTYLKVLTATTSFFPGTEMMSGFFTLFDDRSALMVSAPASCFHHFFNFESHEQKLLQYNLSQC